MKQESLQTVHEDRERVDAAGAYTYLNMYLAVITKESSFHTLTRKTGKHTPTFADCKEPNVDTASDAWWRLA